MRTFIQDLAKEQAAAGADWLDANAGTAPQREPEDLIWLVENIQAAVDTPICLDSANPKALETAIKAVNQDPDDQFDQRRAAPPGRRIADRGRP